MVSIGIDIGGTSIRIGCISANGKLKHFEKMVQGDVLSRGSPDELSACISSYRERHGLGGKVCGLCIGLPGTLNKQKDTILSLPNVRGLDGVRLKKVLCQSQDLPVYLLKDVSALFYYDRLRFEIGDENVVVACYIGTGIGNAIYIDGKLYEGANGSAGELGHIPIWGSHEPCGCGNIGCAELHAGGNWLDKLLRSTFPDTEISELFVKHKAHPLLAEYVACLATVIASEINVLDPKDVILGGGVVSMRDFPIMKLEQEIRMRTRKPFPERNLQFIRSDNKGENGVIGAGLYVWEQAGAAQAIEIKNQVV